MFSDFAELGEAMLVAFCMLLETAELVSGYLISNLVLYRARQPQIERVEILTKKVVLIQFPR